MDISGINGNDYASIIAQNNGQNVADLTGVSVGYICHLENGTRSNPSIETMEKISQVLNKSILEVFFK